MDRSLREAAATAGSVLTLLLVILFVSTDAETVVALGSVCAVGYVVYCVYRTSGAARSLRSRVTPQARRAIGVAVAVAAVVAVADEADETLWLAGMIAFGYTGYRSGRVLRGALHGAVAGVCAAVALVVLVGGVLLLAGVFDVGGTRELLYRGLFAPGVIGFFTLLWSVFVLLLGAITGLVSGGVGGAIARLLRTGTE